MTQGTLYIVATPIGNLEDITLRAIRILREVDLVAAEDTRHSRKLLTHLGIVKPLTSYFDQNERWKGEKILQQLRDGKSIALISDAGSPCIADPGFRLVRDAVASGITVVPVPGPSAVIAALSASGLPTDSFVFEGFLPARSVARRQKLSALATERRVLICYESPKRLLDTLADMAELLGNRQAVVGRELTKLHEEFQRGTIAEIMESFAQREIRGELVLLVAPAIDNGEAIQDLAPLLTTAFADGLSLRDAVRRVCEQSGRHRSDVYAEALRLQEEEK
jgi:16S rRNA (cytidine1402-2'-O)-methyltransferase